MMAFFLVMWLISIVPREELKGIAEYFRMPLRVALTGGPSSSAETSAVPGGGRDPLRSDGDERRAQGNRVEAQPMVDAERRDHHRLENLKKRLENVIENSPVLKSFRPQLLIDMTTEGLRIQIIDNQNRPMFATGRAEVQPYMRDILRELGPVPERAAQQGQHLGPHRRVAVRARRARLQQLGTVGRPRQRIPPGAGGRRHERKQGHADPGAVVQHEPG